MAWGKVPSLTLNMTLLHTGEKKNDIRRAVGFRHTFLGRFTQRYGLKHAEFSDITFKVSTNLFKKAIDSAITFYSPLQAGT